MQQKQQKMPVCSLVGPELILVRPPTREIGRASFTEQIGKTVGTGEIIRSSLYKKGRMICAQLHNKSRYRTLFSVPACDVIHLPLISR